MVGTAIDDLIKLQVRESCPCDRATERYRSAIGIHARRYERKRLEAACERALAINATSYSSGTPSSKSGLDRTVSAGGRLTERYLTFTVAGSNDHVSLSSSAAIAMSVFCITGGTLG